MRPGQLVKSSRMAAKATIMKALDCEQSGHMLEACRLFEEGIESLHEAIEKESHPSRHYIMQDLLHKYNKHMRKMTDIIQYNLQQNKILIELYTIPLNAVGKSYQTLFSQYLDDTIKEIQIYEPSVANRSHIKNIVNFLELCTKMCENLKYIRLFTRRVTKVSNNMMQIALLEEIRNNMQTSNITFNYTFYHKVPEVQVVLSSGIIIYSDRGLHIYQPNKPIYSLGMCDYDFRKCFRTEIKVWKTTAFKHLFDGVPV